MGATMVSDEQIKVDRVAEAPVMDSLHPALNLDAATISSFCERHSICRLSLFGSHHKGTATPDSDSPYSGAAVCALKI